MTFLSDLSVRMCHGGALGDVVTFALFAYNAVKQPFQAAVHCQERYRLVFIRVYHIRLFLTGLHLTAGPAMVVRSLRKIFTRALRTIIVHARCT